MLKIINNITYPQSRWESERDFQTKRPHSSSPHKKIRIRQSNCIVAIDVPLLKTVCCVTSSGDKFRSICSGTVNRETLINAQEDDLAHWAFAGRNAAILDDPRD